MPSTQPTFDVEEAIGFGQLVNAAYATSPGDLTNRAGEALSAGGVDYTVVTTIYANDLATDMNPGRVDDDVSIGLICQDEKTGDVAIAIRGTEGMLEWMHDAEFLQVPCPFLAGAGHTEDGFTDMYVSLRTGAASGAPTVINTFAKLPFRQPVGSVTLCGHSLGGALATLLALDMAANTKFTVAAVYTYGSPRTGDSLFARSYDQAVKNSWRIANRLDVITALPPPIDYEHVLNPHDLNPIRLVPLPPKVLVKYSVLCEHSLATYLYLLSLQSGGPVLALEPACKP
ncbi:lipase family protein [Mycobacterium sp.]|uniref:lipase family protein n=1 Tax=Mycobacterium sp. TaxID=1785 RepID=UPI002BA0D177|nr:lipase family protein [Mycobacterium sp.]HTY34069.1 lipase family protein [Mycobacterium sp.]